MATNDVSVVIPAYNAAKFIVDALDSITRQTCRPKEIIVVDDGSADETSAVVQQWIADAGGDVPVQLRTQANQGAPATRNNGIKQASGQWIALLDADDIWEPWHLAQLLHGVNSLPGAVGAYGAGRLLVDGELDTRLYDEFWDHPSKTYGRPIAGSTCLEINKDIFPRLVKGNFIKPSSLMFSRAAAQEIGLFDVRLRTGEDREFLVRLIFTGKLVYCPESITQYRWHDENLSNGKNAKRNAENALRVLDCIMSNSKLALSKEQLQDCQAEARLATKAYLYACSMAGAGEYARGLQIVRTLFGPRHMVAALNVKHMAHCLMA